MGTIDPESAWQLHPKVSVRPEPFGALLYHFDTRKLSFLKDRTLLTIVESLADSKNLREACQAAGVAPEHLPTYLTALGTLVDSKMLMERGT